MTIAGIVLFALGLAVAGVDLWLKRSWRRVKPALPKKGKPTAKAWCRVCRGRGRIRGASCWGCIGV